jgi:hypothetical protein
MAMQLLPPPGPQRTRQLTLLGILVTVLVVYWVYQPAAPPARTNMPGTSPSVAKAGTPGSSSILPPSIRLAALGAPGENPDTGRNPFRFGAPPPPPAPPAPAFVPPPVETAPPPPPPPPPWPPPIQLTLTALWEDVDTKTRGATLLDPKTNAQYQVIQGSTIDGRYKVLKIGEQTVTVAYLDGSGQKTLTKR